MGGPSPQVRRSGNLSPLSVALEELLARREARVRAKERLAPLVWPEVVGSFYAERTEVTHVEQGVVHVWCNSPALAHQLTTDAEEIIRRLNAALAGDYVKELRASTTRRRRKGSVGEVGIPRPPSPTRGEIERTELTEQEIAAIEREATRISDKTLRERFRAAAMAHQQARKWRLKRGYVPCHRCGWLSPPPLKHCTKCGRPL